MHPKVDESPLEFRDLTSLHRNQQSVVFDTIYNPVETRLLREAKAAGCITVPGMEMFVRQAVGQFELWTGEPAPVELFRQVTLQRLIR
ncbi:MAG: hypothetical protein HC898_08005 [Phycisphaerales bacterium]|nr:hypothetical protein [Phycisphaerales bacterium]